MLKRALLLLTLAPAALAAQGRQRVDPRLLLARRLVGAGAAGAAVRAGPAPAATLSALLDVTAPLAPAADGRVWLRTLARVGPRGVAALNSAGARTGARAGDVVSALVPLDALPRLAALPGLVYLEAATTLRSAEASGPPPARPPGEVARGAAPANDVGVDEVDVAALRQREGSRFYGLAGQGTIVGIYDSGLDLAHADFSDGAGGSRVTWAWDQTAAGPGPGALGPLTLDYGSECTAARIAAATCALRDANGHGTHIAGTAAGNGSATGNGMPAYRFTGVAPAADLIVVKGGDAAFTSDRVVDGVAYIFERAAELGRPAVVNLSMSTQNGPHDGSSNFERALDALVGPGRMIAAAAGNEAVNADESPAIARAPVHAGGRLAAGASDGVELVVPAYTPAAGAANDGAVLDLWYDGRDSLTVIVTTPAGTRFRLAAGDSAALETPEGAIVGDNGAGGPNPNNGDREALIGLVDDDPTAPPAAGRWRIEVEGARVTGTGRWDLWLVGSTMKSSAQLTALDGPAVRNQDLVAVPGTATRAITVAAYASRHDWLGPGGSSQSFPVQEPLGDIAYFSNPGPRRDGVLKPEIAAPGKIVVSSMSRDASTWTSLPSFVEADGVHAVLMGTSMATPFVAGAVALLLQLRPTLTPEDARALLASAARQDAFTGHPRTGEPDGTPNAQWGYGKLDVAAAVHRLGLPAGSLTLEVQTALTGDTVPSPGGARLTLLQLRLTADAAEAQQVERLGFQLVGRDTAARFLLVRDDDGDGVADSSETVVASAPVRLQGTAVHLTLPGPVVPAGVTREYLAVLQLGAGVPNGARFRASYLGGDLVARGVLSGLSHAAGPGGAVTSPERATTVLHAGEQLNLSQNPVRFAPLVINYESRPTAVSIFTAAGTRVRVLSGPQLEEGRASWDLNNDRGDPVASGVYLLVIEAPTGRILRKLIVAR